MIIRMKDFATKDEIQKVVNYLKSKNLEIKDVSSDKVTIFGVIGDTTQVDYHGLYAFSGVGQVTRVMTPFKKASRAFHEADTVIEFPNGLKVGGDNFVVMAGPCSVENAEQLRIIAHEVKASGSNFLRGAPINQNLTV